MMTLILTILSGLVGIFATWISYKMNPKQKILDQLDNLSHKKIQLEKERDDALKANDTNALTIAGNNLIGLQNTEARLLQRLRDINIGK